MTELEKVVTGLEYCSTPGLCIDCVYHGKHCTINMYADAIKLLKEQQETIASLQSTINKLTKAIAEQPEQKHGHWKQVEAGFTDMMCSECGELALLDDDRDYVLSKHCPNCGAIMDGDVEMKND